MNKTAKEMFEELGWTYAGTETVNVYYTASISYVYNPDGEDKDKGIITFNNLTRSVNVSRVKLPSEIAPCFHIRKKVLAAINKQVEELGWNEEVSN